MPATTNDRSNARCRRQLSAFQMTQGGTFFADTSFDVAQLYLGSTSATMSP
jgi:hypothetical protein